MKKLYYKQVNLYMILLMFLTINLGGECNIMATKMITIHYNRCSYFITTILILLTYITISNLTV
jgi:hypothetical protein